MRPGADSAPGILVSGMIAGTPGQGGASWAILQYLLGLRRLGSEVWFVEPVSGSPSAVVVDYCERVMERFDLGGRWALLPDDPDAAPVGLSRRRMREVAAGSDVLLNVAGMLTSEELLGSIPVRAYLDLDPVFTQLWAAEDGVDMRFEGHTHFVTIGDNVGAPSGLVPDCGRDWIPTLPPVVLENWPRQTEAPKRSITTVGHWRSYGSIHRGNVHLGQKAHSMRELLDLAPRLTGRLELALAIDPGERTDMERLACRGWELLDPGDVAADPDSYRTFVQSSWAELGVSKSGYVAADSGWFSDRSACYLSSGRPVIAEDTGFGRRLPTGEGLIPFRSSDDVVAAVELLDADYQRHGTVAREIAEVHLDSDRVLSTLLEALGG